MTLSELADRLVVPRGASLDWPTRVTLTNFVLGIQNKSHKIDGFVHRLQDCLSRIDPRASSVHVDRLHTEISEALNGHVGDRFFLNTDRDIATDLNRRALSFASNAALQFWFDDPGLRDIKGPLEVSAMCERLNRREYAVGKAAGVPNDALWLTPKMGDAEDNFEKAKELVKSGVPADDVIYSEIANDVRDLMGLSHFAVQTGMIGLVTRRTIEELMAPALAGASRRFSLMGPSVIEGRCHGRWRHWNGPDYGRTFDLNDFRSRTVGIDSGAAEAVSGPIPLDEIEEFVFVGTITKPYNGNDRTFAKRIGVDSPTQDILRELHRLTGL